MSEKGNVRIIDIAKLAGVSVGTVDRVLHNRGRVSEENRVKIQNVLKEIDYEPNLVARLLASKHKYSLVAVVPSYAEGEYWSSVCNGINRAVRESKKFNIKLDYIYFDQEQKESFLEILEKLKTESYDGVLIATLFGDFVIELSAVLDEKGTPYVYIDADIPGQKNRAYFGADSFASGTVAAKLMLNEVGRDADVVIAQIISSKEVSTQMQNREQGFRDYLISNGFRGNIFRIDLNSDNCANSLSQFEEIVLRANSLVGGIVFNSRIYELALLLDQTDAHIQEKVKLIGYDAVINNVDALKKGQISYLIAQHSEAQGYQGIRFLSNYLLFNQQLTDKINLMPIDILMKENVDYYNNYTL